MDISSHFFLIANYVRHNRRNTVMERSPLSSRLPLSSFRASECRETRTNAKTKSARRTNVPRVSLLSTVHGEFLLCIHRILLVVRSSRSPPNEGGSPSEAFSSNVVYSFPFARTPSRAVSFTLITEKLLRKVSFLSRDS